MQTQESLPVRDASTSKSLRTHYEIDPAHASAQFKVRHLMVSHVRGELGPVAGQAFIGDDVTRSEVVASIDAAGLATRDAARDAHLRGADFLDVERHPKITFRSTGVTRGTGALLLVAGELTIRGVTRPATLEVELSDEIRDPWGNVKRGVSARTRIDRKDFGVSWNAAMDTGGLVVGDVVEIAIDLELVKKPA
jgi:polyisoprenoid-binding protein YceI